MSGSYVSAGARLAFHERGAGVPVVFLHPTPLDHRYWLPLTAELPGVRAIIPDFRGHGQSELGDLLFGGFALAPEAPVLTMEQLADDLLVLLEYLHLERAIFAGCSIGGYVMLEFARRAPTRIGGMAIICAKPQPDAEANLAKRAGTIAQALNGGNAALFDGMAQTLIGATARRQHPEIVTELRSHMTLTAAAEAAVQAGLAVRHDSVPSIADIRVPILAVCGGEDPGVTAEEMSAYKSAPGGCDFHLLPDAGHYAAYEQPHRVAALMAGWLHQFGA